MFIRLEVGRLGPRNPRSQKRALGHPAILARNPRRASSASPVSSKNTGAGSGVTVYDAVVYRLPVMGPRSDVRLKSNVSGSA